MKQIDGKATRVVLGQLTDAQAQARAEAAEPRPRRWLTFSPGEKVWIAMGFGFWCLALPLLLLLA